MITRRQMIAARALMGIKQTELAILSGITVTTIANLEQGATHRPHAATLERIQAALEDAGIQVIDRNKNGGKVVKLKGSLAGLEPSASVAIAS